MSKIGKEMPATGIFYGSQHADDSLERQGVELEKPYVDTVIGYKKERGKTAMKLLRRTQASGTKR